MKRSTPLLVTLLFVGISSCHFFGQGIRGNGNIITVNRPAGNFNSVEVSGNIDLHVKQDSSFSVRVETDENLMEYIEVRNNGDELWVGVRNHYNLDPTKSIDVFVSAPVYKKLTASGACDITSENAISSTLPVDIDLSGASNVNMNLSSPKVDVELSGASKLDLRGKTRDFSIDGSGASEIRCFDLLSENVDVDLSGAGHAEVFASVNLKAGVSGAGSIRYKGTPSVSQSVSGAGSVSKAD